MEYVSSHDALTALPNRSFLLKELQKKEELLEPFLLCLVDIDQFALVNDEYGAHAGDMLLKHLAKLIKQSLEGEFVARIYGDCFAIVFSLEKNLQYIQKLLLKLEQNIQTQPLLYTQEDQISFEVSIFYDDYKNEGVKEYLERLQHSLKRYKLKKSS